jgi:DNA-binding XRE family transcriptional regulator
MRNNFNANDVERSMKKLKSLREAAGLSQERLARLADCSTSTVRLAEKGWRPSPEMCRQLTRAIERYVPPARRSRRSAGDRRSA